MHEVGWFAKVSFPYQVVPTSTDYSYSSKMAVAMSMNTLSREGEKRELQTSIVNS